MSHAFKMASPAVNGFVADSKETIPNYRCQSCKGKKKTSIKISMNTIHGHISNRAFYSTKYKTDHSKIADIKNDIKNTNINDSK